MKIAITAVEHTYSFKMAPDASEEAAQKLLDAILNGPTGLAKKSIDEEKNAEALDDELLDEVAEAEDGVARLHM